MLKLYEILQNIYQKILEIYEIVIDFTEKVPIFFQRLRTFLQQLTKEIYGTTYLDPDNPIIPSTSSRIDIIETELEDASNFSKDADQRFVLHTLTDSENTNWDLVYSILPGSTINENRANYDHNKLNSIIYILQNTEIPIPIKLDTALSTYEIPTYGSDIGLNIDTTKMFGYVYREGNPAGFSISRKSSYNPILSIANLKETLDADSDDLIKNISYSNKPLNSSLPNNLAYNVLSFKTLNYAVNASSRIIRTETDTFLPTIFLIPISKRYKYLMASFSLIFTATRKASMSSYFTSSIRYLLRPFAVFLKIVNNQFVMETSLDTSFGADPDGFIPIGNTIEFGPFNPSEGPQAKSFFIYNYLFKSDAILKSNLNFDPAWRFIGIGFYTNISISIGNPSADGDWELFLLSFEHLNLFAIYNPLHFWAHEANVNKVLAPIQP